MFKCRKCEYEGESKGQLGYHVEVEHKKEVKLEKDNRTIKLKRDEKGEFKCYRCGKGSRIPKAMRRHKECIFKMRDEDIEMIEQWGEREEEIRDCTREINEQERNKEK
jgi:DNA-directed RNA polymerase subunit M/transcription elongation factor TFIIS